MRSLTRSDSRRATASSSAILRIWVPLSSRHTLFWRVAVCRHLSVAQLLTLNDSPIISKLGEKAMVSEERNGNFDARGSLRQ